MPEYFAEEHFEEQISDETQALENDPLNGTFDGYLNIKEGDRYTGPGSYSGSTWSYSYNYLIHKLYAYQTFQQKYDDIFNITLHSELFGFNHYMTENESFSRQLDQVYNDMDESYALAYEQKNYQVKMVTGVFGTFAVGVVSYLLRAGSLLSCFLSATPLWKGLDPIAVLASKKKKDDQNEPSSETDTDTDSDTLFD